jgi:esterase/lipase
LGISSRNPQIPPFFSGGKMKNKWFALCFIIFLNGCTDYNHKNPYSNMEILQYDNAKAYVFKNTSSEKLIVTIEGSSWTSVLGSKRKQKWISVRMGNQIIQALGDKYTIFIPEKWDWNPETYYDMNFKSRINYTMDNLLECYLTSINMYLSEYHYSSIVLIGQSEGAALLPIIYESIKDKYNVTCMVSLYYGGLSAYESFSILKDSAKTPENNKQFMQYYCDMYETNDDNSYKTESQILTLMRIRPFEYYKDINIPVLFIHGEKDYNLPVESTKYIQNHLPEKPFEYLYYKNMAHGSAGYFQTIKERKYISEWIIKNDL